jgi:predicted dehydrogenase
MGIGRRGFLAGVLAAPGVAGPGKIRTGILGVEHSHLAGKLAAMQGNPDYEVVSVCEPDDATRRAHAGDKALRGLRWVSLDEMLADKSLDLIVFEGEVRDAIPFGKRVIEAGKHLHLEKPPTNRMEPFRDLVEAARKRDRLLQLGYLWRFHAGTSLAIEAAKQGWLGEILMIRATIDSDRGPEQRAVEARYPGGSMFELGGHMIDRVVAALGRPARVRHWLRHDTSIKDGLKDNTLAVFEYASTLAIIVSSSKVANVDRHRSFEVIGTDGTVMVQPMEPAPVVRIDMREDRGPYRKGTQEMALRPQPRFIRDFEELGRAIKAGRPLQYSYDHELLLHETLLRASGEIS